MKWMTVKELVDEVRAKHKTIVELENALKALRKSSNWEDGIAEEDRVSVKLVYAELIRQRNIYTNFINIEIVIDSNQRKVIYGEV